MKTLLTLALFLVILPRSAFAHLNWNSRLLELNATPTDTVIVGAFPFINSSTKPITISSITTSCGCTTAELEKKIYAPGESGSIKAKFTIGTRTGLQQKVITVKSDDPERPTTVLIMKVTIPQTFEVSPRFVYWNKSQEAVSKTVLVKVTADDPVKLLSATGTGTSLKTELKEVTPGREYQVILTPLDTSSEFTENVVLKADLPTGRDTYTVYGAVRDPNPTLSP